MELPRILILTDSSVADDLAACIEGLEHSLCPPGQLPPEPEAVILLDLAQRHPEQSQSWVEDLRRRQPHQPLLLVLASDATPPEALLQQPLELLWRPLRQAELRQRLQLLAQRTPRSAAAEGFRQVFEKHHAMMLLIRPESGEIVDANPAASRFYGYDRETLRRMHIHQINQLSDQEVAREVERARTQVTNYFTFLHRLANGEVRTVEVHSTPVEIEGQQLLFSILHDITQRRRAERALQQNEALYRQIVETAEEGFWIIDAENNTTFVNRKMAQMLGFDGPEEVLGQSAFSFIGPEGEEKFRYHLERRRQGISEVIDFRLQTRTGQALWTSMSNSPILDAAGNYLGAMALVTDISERKHGEEQIQDALKEREILLREIHHRVKNNFQVIISLLNMQCRKLQNSPATEPLLEMRNRIRSMALIHERIYLSENLVDVDFGEYLQYLTRELYTPGSLQAEQIKLSFSLEEVLLDIDQAIPCGLLVNELLTNAFKYAFPPGWED
ncbi:MAG: sensor histidine kinase, partial [Candidatus Sericytochromatia bacterium]